ncbi:MAG: glycerol-3-phosphate dehydrogenase/oxidase [Cytophagales bacterium]|nr:MAG: glycerol-3-phosphate dehydrogenase/oxidase [Cytophagales bacterium]
MFSALHRKDFIAQLKTTEYDTLVIGGGITGAGIALDCASRGLKVALIDKQDFGAGTSSRSTKLIHGGLRYLKQLEVGLVMEVGRERETLHRNCPHLVVPEKMLLPLIKNGTYGTLATSFGLWVYDKLAGVKNEEQRVMLSKEETAAQEPLLRQDILEGGGLYIEYRTDDARLTAEVIKTAVRYKANCLNYVSAVEFVYNERGRISATKVKDEITGEILTVKAKTTVNAAGPWVDEIRDFDTSNHKTNKYLQLTKGVHLVVPYHRLPLQQSIYFDVPNGRMMFAIPRGEITYVGTTDTTYKDEINEPKTTAEDVSYILASANSMFPSVNLSENDIISSWAGLRPLIHEDGKSPSEISRKDEIFVSEAWLISIAGGKLTGFRKMAERVTDKVFQRLKKKYQYESKDCFTDKITLSGGDFKSYDAVEEYVAILAEELAVSGLGQKDANYLVFNYGKNAKMIVDKIADIRNKDYHPEVNMQIVMAKAELWYCFHYEFVNNLSDFFIRRTGRLYFNRPSIDYLLEPIAEELSNYLEAAKSKEMLMADFNGEYQLVVTFESENS